MASDMKKGGSIPKAAAIMLVVSLVFAWVPFFGPLIAGIIGGKEAGGVTSAVVAVFVPGLVLGILLFVLATSISGMPVIGAVAGAGGFALALFHVVPLLLGAISGAVFLTQNNR